MSFILSNSSMHRTPLSANTVAPGESCLAPAPFRIPSACVQHIQCSDVDVRQRLVKLSGMSCSDVIWLHSDYEQTQGITGNPMSLIRALGWLESDQQGTGCCSCDLLKQATEKVDCCVKSCELTRPRMCQDSNDVSNKTHPRACFYHSTNMSKQQWT